MVKIRWLKSAKADLKEVYEYISSDSKSYTKLQVDRIYKQTQILKQHPNSGKLVEELDNPEIRADRWELSNNL